MLKALLLDLDETLCDTLGANERARELMAQALAVRYGADIDAQDVASRYVRGIYRDWSDSQRARYLPIIGEQGEGAFRLQLIR
ncbi:MAG: HAD family hydrolase, partial [Halieaceae bacterium]|nr:HAD family hydrolase [Halieaceae bacterium]